jgi:hypothetical protein
MPLNALLCSGNDALPQHWSVLRAIHTLTSLQNYIRLFGGLSPIRSTRRRREKCLMWGTRGPYPPTAAMVGYGCVGRCWQLKANVRLPTVGIVAVYGSIFLFLRRSHIFLTSDLAAK